MVHDFQIAQPDMSKFYFITLLKGLPDLMQPDNDMNAVIGG